MDGDIAPLAHIAELPQIYGARLVVDEAHATGNVGPEGRGAIAAAGLEGEVDVVIGTLGKALGSYGAYACGSAEIVEYLVNTARPLIFSTAPGPPRSPARWPRSSCCSNARTASPGFARTPGPFAARSPRRAPRRRGRDAHRAADRRRGARGAGLCRRRSSSACSPGDPPADGAGGHVRLRLTAMASHTPGELRDAAGRSAPPPGGRASSPSSRSRRRPSPSRRWPRSRQRSSAPNASRRRRAGRARRRAVRLRAGAGAAGVRRAACRRGPKRRRRAGATAEIGVAASRPGPAAPTELFDSTARPEPRRARVRGLFVTGTDTGAGKCVLSACLLAAMRSAASAGARQAGADGHRGARRRGWPRRRRAARRASAGRDAEAVAPLRFGRPSRRTWPPSWPEGRSTPRRCSRAARDARRRRASARRRGRRGAARAARGRAGLVRDLAVALGAAARGRRAARARHDQPHAADARAARAAGLRSAGGRDHALAGAAGRDRALEPRDDRAARGGRGRDAADLAGPDPARWRVRAGRCPGGVGREGSAG